MRLNLWRYRVKAERRSSNAKSTNACKVLNQANYDYSANWNDVNDELLSDMSGG